MLASTGAIEVLQILETGPHTLALEKFTNPQDSPLYWVYEKCKCSRYFQTHMGDLWESHVPAPKGVVCAEDFLWWNDERHWERVKKWVQKVYREAHVLLMDIHTMVEPHLLFPQFGQNWQPFLALCEDVEDDDEDWSRMLAEAGEDKQVRDGHEVWVPQKKGTLHVSGPTTGEVTRATGMPRPTNNNHPKKRGQERRRRAWLDNQENAAALGIESNGVRDTVAVHHNTPGIT